MPNPNTALNDQGLKPPNAESVVTIKRKDLPLHCPVPGSRLWDSHPRVYIPIEDAVDKKMLCPYCSTRYILDD